MIEIVKKTAKLLLPPVIINIYRGVKGNIPQNRTQNTFDGIYSHFTEIPDVTDYETWSSLNEAYSQTVQKLKEYESGGIMSKSHICSQIDNLLPLLIASIRYEGKLSILDYGGGSGSTYINCLMSIDTPNLSYYVHDLPDTMSLGRRILSRMGDKKYDIRFIDDLSDIDKINIVYLGSVLQYISDYRLVLQSIMGKNPEYILITDNFMGQNATYATVQVNMPGRRMAYWIFQLDEIIKLLSENGYKLAYKSVNHQPFHHFNNFPEEYRIKDSCNLLFRKLAG